MNLFDEWWVVETKDRKSDAFYGVGGKHQSREIALCFAKNCLRGNRKRYAQIVKYEIHASDPELISDLKRSAGMKV